jgi:Ca2+-transporting ATPase
MVPVLASYWLVAGVLNESHAEAVTASFLTLAFARLWHIFNMRSAESRLIHNEIVTNPCVWGALVLCSGLLLGAVYAPGLARVLSLSSPGAHTWVVIATLSIVPLILGQTIKMMQNSRRRRSSEAQGRKNPVA